MRASASMLVVLLGAATSAEVAAQERPGSTAERVSRLRGEVDDLAHRLEAERRRARDTLAALQAERMELERQLRLERVRAETLQRVADRHRARADGLEGESHERLLPVRRSVEAAKVYVLRTLPFEREARTRVLERIEADLAALHPDPAGALARLWRFVEEEEALTREVALTRQPLTIDGERQLVDVARIGMALLYFRTASGRFGWARPTGGDWRFEVVEAGPAQGAIEAVFEALDENRAFGPSLLLLPETKP